MFENLDCFDTINNIIIILINIIKEFGLFLLCSIIRTLILIPLIYFTGSRIGKNLYVDSKVGSIVGGVTGVIGVAITIEKRINLQIVNL